MTCVRADAEGSQMQCDTHAAKPVRSRVRCDLFLVRCVQKQVEPGAHAEDGPAVSASSKRSTAFPPIIMVVTEPRRINMITAGVES